MKYKDFNTGFSLDNKISLITGAAQGIGKAIASLFAEKGSDLILVDLQKEKLKEVADSLEKQGVEVLPLVYDITDKSNVKNMVKESIDIFSRIDILINCAGIVKLDDAENLSETAWDKTLGVNLKAPFLISQEVGKKMMDNNGGKIINIASQAGMIALDKHIAYSSSKAGLIEMTKVLAYEWAEYNINVNAVSPTVVLTELGKEAWSGEAGETMKKKIPAKRFAYPDEIAAGVLFLASDAAQMITGENLVIDGGYTIK